MMSFCAPIGCNVLAHIWLYQRGIVKKEKLCLLNCDFLHSYANNVMKVFTPMNASPNKEIFTKLINENKGIVYKVCNTYCRNKNSRDDLAQEILYNLWKSFYSFRTDLKFSTWMYRIALNVAISFYRKE